MKEELKARFHQELLDLMVLYNEKVLRQVKDSFKDAFSPAQFFTLSAIVSSEGMTMSQLAHISSMQKQQVTKLVNFLVDHEYVIRVPCQKDRRIIRVEATEKGTQYMEEYSRKNINEVSRLFSVLTEKESEELLSAFATINGLLKKIKAQNFE